MQPGSADAQKAKAKPRRIARYCVFYPAPMPPLITVWLEVRILPGPPRSRGIGEISCRRATCPELAGFLYDRFVSETADLWFGRRIGLFSPSSKSRFPATETA